MNTWTKTSQTLPPNGEVVETKIDDNTGEPRNFAKLKRYNNLWFLEDGSMYVYYVPTHWRGVYKNEK